MAIGRVSGEMLLPNLERGGVDLAIETSLLYFDVTNNRIGVRTALPPVYFTGTINGTTLTVTIPPTSGAIAVNMTLAGTGIVANTVIVSGSGTSWTLSQTYSVTVQGSFTGQIAPNFDFVVNGTTNITSTTNTLTVNDGALVVGGGVGIGKELRVGGDIYSRGKKVATEDAFASRRKTFSFAIPSLASGATYLYTAQLGYASIIYSLGVTAPVKVEVFGTLAGQTANTAPNPYEQNPYTFIATSRRTYDDGTIFFSDGTSMQTRQYSIFANLEDPSTKNIYFKITGINDIYGGWPASDLSYAATFTGSITGTTLTVSGTVTGRPLAAGMTITGPGGIIASTKIVTGSGTTWTVDKTYSSTVAGSMTGTLLTNTLSIKYIDAGADAGSTDISTVSSLPTGYNGQIVYLTTNNTLYVYFNNAWRPI